MCNFTATFHPQDLIRLIVEMAKHYAHVPTVPPLAMTTQKLIVNRLPILRVKSRFLLIFIDYTCTSLLLFN